MAAFQLSQICGGKSQFVDRRFRPAARENGRFTWCQPQSKVIAKSLKLRRVMLYHLCGNSDKHRIVSPAHQAYFPEGRIIFIVVVLIKYYPVHISDCLGRFKHLKWPIQICFQGVVTSYFYGQAQEYYAKLAYVALQNHIDWMYTLRLFSWITPTWAFLSRSPLFSNKKVSI